MEIFNFEYLNGFHMYILFIYNFLILYWLFIEKKHYIRLKFR